MLSSQNTNSEETKRMWQKQFEAIKLMKIISFEPIMKNSWTEERREYKIILDMTMDESSKDAPIPYYGYSQGRILVLLF